MEEWRVEGGGLWAVCGCEGLQVSIYHTEWYLSMIVWEIPYKGDKRRATSGFYGFGLVENISLSLSRGLAALMMLSIFYAQSS